MRSSRRFWKERRAPALKKARERGAVSSAGGGGGGEVVGGQDGIGDVIDLLSGSDSE